ncbi:MAG: 3-beta hydroxysteroid dehydrogenase, partial [Phaeodactylibacter sp.]|nr:3-beta hydroxysteroid dehydrogenase [Phaeodactylibacter sp.]
LQSAYRLFGIASEPPVTPFLAKQLSTAHWYDISAARQDFGYVPSISIDEGMERLRQWVDEQEEPRW